MRSALRRLRSDELATESAWGFAVELSMLFGTILSFTLLGRSLGAAGYGGYASLYAIVGPLVTLAASGVVLAILQHVIRDAEPLESTARSCLAMSLGLGVFLTVIGTAAALAIVDTLSLLAIVSLLATEFIAAPMVQVAASTVQAGTGFTPSAHIRLMLLWARVVVITTLFTTGSLTVENFGVSMLAVSTTLGVASLAMTGKRYGFLFVPGRVHVRHLKTNLLFSTSISASALNSDGDKLVMAANRLVVDVGLYAAAYRIISFGLIPIGALMQVTHRRFLVHTQGVRGEHLRRSLKFGAIGGVYGIVFGIAIFLAAPVLPILMGSEFDGSVEMVRWLAPVVFFRALGSFALNGLMGLNLVGFRAVLTVVNAAVSLGLYIVLIPLLGWQGAAIGTLISEVLVAASSWAALVLVQRRRDSGLARGA